MTPFVGPHDYVFVDAVRGDIVDRHALIQPLLYREVYKFMQGQPPDMDPNEEGIQYPETYPLCLWTDEEGHTSPMMYTGQTLWEASYPDRTSTASANWTGLERAYNYFYGKGRDSYDGAGSHLITYVNGYDLTYVNGAAYNGSSHTMNFGSGDGTNSGPLAADHDVVAHELAHGVTQFTSGLIYANEPGALNESFSDVMAAAAQWTALGGGTPTANVWKIGESSYTPYTSGDATRYLNDPHQHIEQEDFYPGYQDTLDNGGVHWNSGIPNLAFYLLSEGGTHPHGKSSVNVPAVTFARAQAIFYQAFTNYLFPGSRMVDARVATVLAAQDLYASSYPPAISATALAWDAVGVPTINNNTHPINISTRADVGTGSAITIAGFVLSGSGTKQFLLRGLGPKLTDYGISGVLSNPEAKLFNSSGTMIASNDNWGNASTAPQLVSANTTVGAAQLTNNSNDASLLATLGSGAYSVQLTGVSSTVGHGMVEVFDTNTNVSPQLVNISTRCLVTPSQPAIAGVVVQGAASKTLLIRALGPTLSALGVSPALANPRIQVYSGSTVIYENDNWSNNGLVTTATSLVGASPALPANSLDSAIVVALPAGGYSVVISSVGGDTGIALVEIYDVNNLIP